MRSHWRTWWVSWKEWINPVPLLAIAVACIFAWLIIFGDQGVLTWRALANKRAELEQEQATLAAKQKLMEDEVLHLEDPHYLEPIIRRELGLVKPGEVIFQFPEEEKGE